MVIMESFMAEFFDLTPADQALKRVLDAMRERHLEPEEAAAEDALGRILARPLCSPQALPSFVRSTMDGYALRAADSYGASETLPAYLQVAGEVLMGESSGFVIESGRCALVHTGGMVPEGADAVIMVERTRKSRTGEIELLRPVAVGENLIQIGEDVAADSLLFTAGHRLRPQDIGGLCALGITRVPLVGKPRIAVISTGDEVVSPSAAPEPGQVRDVNSYTIASLIEQAGGTPDRRGVVADDYEAILTEARAALQDSDALVISAGSSVSVRDLTARVIDALGEPGVLVHGVNIKPGKPTILAVCGGKAVIGLPGNPVSAFVSSMLFLLPAVRKLLGLEPRGMALKGASTGLKARLGRNIGSAAGRIDYVPVRLEGEPGAALTAEPVFGKSNLIYTLIHADGLVTVPVDSNGLHRDDEVEVTLFS
mgnify:CR=1 FL=1